MPVDPSISLNIATPQMSSVNPLQMMGQMAVLQNQLNQARLFQQTFAAKQGIGEIMAASPDLDTAFNNVAKSPYAAFAPELLNNIRSAQLAEVQRAAQITSGADTALTSVYKATIGLLGDPTPAAFDRQTSPVLAGMPAGPIKDAATRQIAAYKESLFGGTTSPEDVRKNATAQAVAHGMSPDDVYKMAGAVPPSYQTVTGPQGQPLAGVVSGGGLQGTPSFQPLQPSGAPSPAGGASAGGSLAPISGGAGLGPLVGPTTAQTEFMKGLPKEAMDYQQSLDDRVKGGVGMLQTITEMRDLMSKVKTGPEQAWRQPLAQFASRLGFDPDVVGKIAGGNDKEAFSAAQELQKLFVNTTTAQMRQQIAAGSRWNINEFSAFMKSNPNLETDPTAVNRIFDFWSRLTNIDQAEQSEHASYVRGGGDQLGWGSEWTKRMKDRGWFTTAPGGGTEKGAPSPTPAPATPPARPKVGDFFKDIQ